MSDGYMYVFVSVHTRYVWTDGSVNQGIVKKIYSQGLQMLKNWEYNDFWSDHY